MYCGTSCSAANAVQEEENLAYCGLCTAAHLLWCLMYCGSHSRRRSAAVGVEAPQFESFYKVPKFYGSVA